jgi:hypothetical protein
LEFLVLVRLAHDIVNVPWIKNSIICNPNVGLNVHYNHLLAKSYWYLNMSNLSKFSKLCIISQMEVIFPKVTYFHTQFKNQNIQILNNKCLIDTSNNLLGKKIIDMWDVGLHVHYYYSWASNQYLNSSNFSKILKISIIS